MKRLKINTRKALKALSIMSLIGLNLVSLQSYAQSGMGGGDQGMPIRTSKMTPKTFVNLGVKKAELAQAELPMDFCIVGFDEASKKWLKSATTREILAAFSEFDYCIIVNAKTWDEIFAIKKLLPKNMPLIPMHANWMAERYGLSHYPGVYSHDEAAVYQTYPKGQ